MSVDYENDEADKSENDLINKLSQSFAEPSKATDMIRKLFEIKTAKVHMSIMTSFIVRAALHVIGLHKEMHIVFHDVMRCCDISLLPVLASYACQAYMLNHLAGIYVLILCTGMGHLGRACFETTACSRCQQDSG
jgi:hypothetical protein